MKNSNEWLDMLVGRLFEPDDRRLKTEISRLNRKNSEIQKKQFHGFMHQGKRYYDPQFISIQPALARQPMPTLSFTMQDEAKEFMTDADRVGLHKSLVRQALYLLIYQANTLQEIRDALPECIVPLVPEFRGMSRYIQDHTWLVRSDASAMKSVAKGMPLIERYSVAGLLY